MTARHPKLRAFGNWCLGLAELYVRLEQLIAEAGDGETLGDAEQECKRHEATLGPASYARLMRYAGAKAQTLPGE